MDMTSVANAVRDSMKGFGTKDSKLISAVAKLDPLQIAGLRQVYTSRIRRDLEKDITSETSGYYRDTLLAIVRGPLLHDVHTVQRSIKGLGTKEVLLNDALIGRSKADMRAIKAAYQQTFGKDMVVEVGGDLSLDTKRHFKMIMAASRNEDSSPVMPHQVDQDVNAFQRLAGGQTGTTELEICEIMTDRNDAQIRAIAQQHQQRFQKPLDDVIDSRFSGHMKVARAIDRSASDATLLEAAMKGAGTKEELLIQRVVRVHWNCQYRDQVKRTYEQKYGRTLKARVEGETSGHYRDVLVKCLE